MLSLESRLSGVKDEVLKATETYGRFKAMNQFGVKDYIAFNKWLERVTGEKDFGVTPRIRYTTNETLGDQLVEAFLSKVARLEARNKELDDRIKFLEWQLTQKENKTDTQAMAVLAVCEE
jgi:hypothetical protein